MRAEDRAEARAIAKYWQQFIYAGADTSAPLSPEAAAMFAQAHALLDVASAIRSLTADVGLGLGVVAEALRDRKP